MKKHLTILLIIAGSILNFTGAGIARAEKPIESENSVQAKKKIKLFNGKNLDGWYKFLKEKGRNNDPNGVFTVNNGLLTISGEDWGCITTNEEFENYKLVAEFKWGGKTHDPRLEKSRDSGILIHSVGEDGAHGGTWMKSIECQIIEGGTGDFIVVGDGTPKFSITCPVKPEKQGNSPVFDPKGEKVTVNSGRINWYGRDPEWKDIKGFRGANDVEKPVGKWNKLVCIVKDKEIAVYLNNKLVNHAFDVKPSKGKIQVQSEGAEIIFRKIDITVY